MYYMKHKLRNHAFSWRSLPLHEIEVTENSEWNAESGLNKKLAVWGILYQFYLEM